jgi:hypothetical protein
MLKAVWAYAVFKKIAKYTCSHLEKISEKSTRSTQRNVTRQTSSEYRRLTVPSGRTLNYNLVCAEDSNSGNIWVPPRMWKCVLDSADSGEGQWARCWSLERDNFLIMTLQNISLRSILTFHLRLGLPSDSASAFPIKTLNEILGALV